MKEATSISTKQFSSANWLWLVPYVFRAGFLLQNFKMAFIQERSEGCSDVGRPCVAETRWYGGTDEGLVNVHPMVDLWSNGSEIN